MGISYNSLINSSQGLLPINLLTTDQLIQFCSPNEYIDVNISIESLANKSLIKRIFNLGKNKLIKIIIKNNYYFIGTEEQEIFTDEWTKLKDLNINDQCKIKKHYNVFSKINLITKKEVNTLTSIDRIMESTKEFQLLYLQKLFSKYANIINNKVILNLSIIN